MKYDGYLFLPYCGQLRFTIELFTDSEEATLGPADSEQDKLFPNTQAPTCQFYNQDMENDQRVQALRLRIPTIISEMTQKHWPKYHAQYFDVTALVFGEETTNQAQIILHLDPRPISNTD